MPITPNILVKAGPCWGLAQHGSLAFQAPCPIQQSVLIGCKSITTSKTNQTAESSLFLIRKQRMII
jgi:hypothetical protein